MQDPALCLIIEDHADAQIWLQSAMAQAFPQASICIADSLQNARAQLTEDLDVVLLDIELPDGSGLDLIDELVATGAQVIISSIYDHDAYILKALKRGATGYILKDHPKEELVELLQGIVVHGRPPLSPQIARKVLEFFTHQADRPDPPADVVENSLTSRERDVLTLLAKGYSTTHVAQMLELSPHTVAGYAKTIYRKLNVSSRAEATLEANRLGLVRND
ncbi:MAG: response regulator transcription factor [Pseudomonadota bacterium]